MNRDQRTPSINLKGNPGPYLAVVVSHLDPKYMGSIEVELLKATDSGNLTARTGQTAQVKYLSPFYGVTPYKDLSNNEGYAYTQKSYGMWMVPPDVGTNVLVIFAEGNAANGYWIGCIQDEYMNFMLPGYASTSYNAADRTKKLPVGEYNKKVETAKGRDPTQFIKPANDDFIATLEEQGLLEDGTRGTTTSSARRETPSMVFGISTPGPYDRRPGAPKGRYGTIGATSNTPFNRLGGSSFVMDDGDATLLRKTPANQGPPEYVNVEGGETGGDPTLPHNELVRVRTRTGHQILLHNTEDLIYIGNARGTAWIELTSNGKIDIYSQDSISVHTEQDLNITADRDINMHAGRDFNIKSNRNTNLESIGNWQIHVGGNNKITTIGNIDINSGGNHTETASRIDMNGPVAQKAVPLQTFELSGETATAKESLHKRLPQHEPWPQHENLKPENFSFEKTDITLPEAPIEVDLTDLSLVVPDTFRKST